MQKELKMNTNAEYRKCKCGYNILVYVIYSSNDKPPKYHYFDGHSGNYEQVFVCPGCHDRLNYMTLEG